MPKRIYVEIEGFEDPFFLDVEVEGFDDPIIAFERTGVFQKPLNLKVRIDKKEIKVQTQPR